ncbi:hypothetical protein, partial [Cupriavidus basilensis]|uniref:hypothetical protein n=1 Tax=Cupriavidus basilensis TaxID=68895 RepID=UPI0023E7ADB9
TTNTAQTTPAAKKPHQALESNNQQPKPPTQTIKPHQKTTQPLSLTIPHPPRKTQKWIPA